MGGRKIAYGQKEMSQWADKIRTKLESAEDFEPGCLAIIKSALDQSNDLVKGAMRKLDKLP